MGSQLMIFFSQQILSPDEVVAEIRKSGRLMLQPLRGGMPVDYAWESLETFARDVLPRVRA